MSTSEIDNDTDGAVAVVRKPRVISEELLRASLAKFVKEVPRETVDRILDNYQHLLQDTVEKGGRVQFGGLGVMQTRTLQRNGKTSEAGERIEIVKR